MASTTNKASLADLEEVIFLLEEVIYLLDEVITVSDVDESIQITQQLDNETKTTAALVTFISPTHSPQLHQQPVCLGFLMHLHHLTNLMQIQKQLNFCNKPWPLCAETDSRVNRG